MPPVDDRSFLPAAHRLLIIEPADGSARGDMNVVVSGARIMEVGKSDTERVPAGSSIVDGRGKFLVPGLWDMHVHVFNNGDQQGTNSRARQAPLRDAWT